MKIIEDDVIGELRYLTVEFDRKELIAGGVGVISQGAVQRYFTEKSPDYKVKKCGSFKLDSQRDIVTMRFGVVNRGGVITTVSDEVSEVKLLNPGYDELRERYDTLVIAVGKDAQKFSAILVENEELKEQLSKLQLDKLNGVLAEQEIDLTSDDENPRPTENEVDKMLEDTADLAPTKEITLKEAKKIMEENEKYPGQYQV